MAFPKKAKRTLIEGVSNGDYDLTDPDMTAGTITTLTSTTGNITTVTATTLNTTHLNDADADALKIHGYISTRNTADNSMYVATTAASGYERGAKIAYAPSDCAGGYFDSLYVNTKTTGTTVGEYRAIEAKTTVSSNLAASSIATGLYAKVNVSGASNEVATAIGVDVLLEEEDSGTITYGVGMRVQGGVGYIHHGIDLSGSYTLGALKIPYKAAAAAASPGQFATSFGITEGALADDTCVVGVYNNTGGDMYLVLKVEGLYKTIALVDAS